MAQDSAQQNGSSDKAQINRNNGYHCKTKANGRRDKEPSQVKAHSDGSKGSIGESIKSAKVSAAQKADPAKEQLAAKGLSRLCKVLWDEAAKPIKRAKATKAKVAAGTKKKKCEKNSKKVEDGIPAESPIENSGKIVEAVAGVTQECKVISKKRNGLNFPPNVGPTEDNANAGNMISQFMMNMDEAAMNRMYLISSPMMNADPGVADRQLSMYSARTLSSSTSISSGSRSFTLNASLNLNGDQKGVLYRRAAYQGLIAYRIKHFKEAETQRAKNYPDKEILIDGEAKIETAKNIPGNIRNSMGDIGKSEDYNRAVELLTAKKDEIAGIRMGKVNGLSQ